RGWKVQPQRHTGKRVLPGRLAVHALRRRARAEPPELLTRRATGARPAAARTFHRAPARQRARRGDRLLRRPDGGGAGQRWSGDDRFEHRRLGSTYRLTAYVRSTGRPDYARSRTSV